MDVTTPDPCEDKRIQSMSSSEQEVSTPRAKNAANILLGMKAVKEEDIAESTSFMPPAINRARTGRPISKNSPTTFGNNYINFSQLIVPTLDTNVFHTETPFELAEWWCNYAKINESKHGNLSTRNLNLDDDLLYSKRPRRSSGRALFNQEDGLLPFQNSRYSTVGFQTNSLRFGLTSLPVPSLLAQHLANDKEQSSYSGGQQSDSETSLIYTKSRKEKGSRKRNLIERDINRDISTSRYRGVSKHRMTGKWEVAVWFNGKQQYLGGFEDEEKAAKAYDLATLAVKGEAAVTNFPTEQYQGELDKLQGAKADEVIAYIRRNSCCFTRGRSRFRGVSGQDGHWEARIGNFMNRKNASLGVYKCQEDAARMYDRALLIKKGPKANTNFPVKQYKDEVVTYLHSLHANGELDAYLETDGPSLGLDELKPSQIRPQHLVHVFMPQINIQDLDTLGC